MTFIKKNINTIINIALVIALGFSFLYTQSVEAKFTKLKKDTEARVTKITKATENYGKKLDEALEANNKVNKSLDELIASLKAKYVDNKEGQ
jgi:hypothetical protein